MEIDIALQEKIRDDVLKAIEINKIEGLIDDRPALLIEMGRLIEKVVEQQNIYLNVQAQRQMADIMADEIVGFGPLRPLLEDDTVNDILVNGPH